MRAPWVRFSSAPSLPRPFNSSVTLPALPRKRAFSFSSAAGVGAVANALFAEATSCSIESMAKKWGPAFRPGPRFGFSCAPWARYILGEAGLDLVDDRRKSGFIDDSHVGEHLAVDVDRGLLQAGNERRIRHALVAHRCIDARNPKRAEHTLARATIAVGILPRLHHGFLGDAE